MGRGYHGKVEEIVRRNTVADAITNCTVDGTTTLVDGSCYFFLESFMVPPRTVHAHKRHIGSYARQLRENPYVGMTRGGCQEKQYGVRQALAHIEEYKTSPEFFIRTRNFQQAFDGYHDSLLALSDELPGAVLEIPVDDRRIQYAADGISNLDYLLGLKSLSNHDKRRGTLEGRMHKNQTDEQMVASALALRLCGHSVRIVTRDIDFDGLVGALEVALPATIQRDLPPIEVYRLLPWQRQYQATVSTAGIEHPKDRMLQAQQLAKKISRISGREKRQEEFKGKVLRTVKAIGVNIIETMLSNKPVPKYIIRLAA